MMSFMNCTISHFIGWVLPLVIRNNTLHSMLDKAPDITEKVKSDYCSWEEESRASFQEIENQIRTQYGLPELEGLRCECCSCIILGHWQAAICLTNILLEASLKLALVYKNLSAPQEKDQPLNSLLNSLSDPVKQYMQLSLYKTIDTALEQELVDATTAENLHTYRKRLRNAFFHADMQSMFGDKTTPITGLNFGSQDVEHREVPIQSLPLLLGEALWQNAKTNAIPYFREVDNLIRSTLSKVFPNLQDEHQ